LVPCLRIGSVLTFRAGIRDSERIPVTRLNTSPLHPRFGVEIRGLDLADIAADGAFPAIHDAFERQSLLLFRDQALSDDDHMRLARLFGVIEDRSADERAPDEAFAVPQVSNRAEGGGVTAATDLKTLNLLSNQLWHTDSTFLPTPALANIITARVVTSTGGETEIASTRAAFADMPEALQERLRGAVLRHRYAHSRARISAELAALPMFTKWPDTALARGLAEPGHRGGGGLYRLARLRRARHGGRRGSGADRRGHRLLFTARLRLQSSLAGWRRADLG
jgi:hypothetical protein